ncbi:hypothetical protein Tco_1178860 [Tanacetum coccineum]
MDTKLISAPESNNTLARCWFRRNIPMTTFGSDEHSYPSTCRLFPGHFFLGQMAHLVASITLNSAMSYVMQSVFLTQRTVTSIPIVFSWSDSIRLEGFLSSVLLWLVIIVAVVGVGVTVVVVVESSSVVKLSFVIT